MNHGRTEPSGSTFDDIVDRLGPALWRLTAGYAHDRAARQDLYQEILVAIWKALPRFRGEASISTFVFRIGHNRGVTYRTKRQVRARREVEVEVDADFADPAPDADSVLQRSEQREKLLAAVRRLPVTLSQPIMLQLEGLAVREIAEILGITENNAAVRLNRARNALRESMTRG